MGLILALALALIALSSAVTDDEILIATKALLLKDSPDTNVTIIGGYKVSQSGKHGYYFNITLGTNTLTMSEKYANNLVSVNMDYMESESFFPMIRTAQTIFEQYPSRFKKLDLKIYDPSNKLIGHANLIASDKTEYGSWDWNLGPPKKPEPFSSGVEIW